MLKLRFLVRYRKYCNREASAHVVKRKIFLKTNFTIYRFIPLNAPNIRQYVYGVCLVGAPKPCDSSDLDEPFKGIF